MARKTINLEVGSVYQKVDNGTFYYRYQVNGRRKSVGLYTKNKTEATKKAKELIPTIQSNSLETIAAHVKEAKSLGTKQNRLEVNRIWEVYSKHPDRVQPKSQKIVNMYKLYLSEFTNWLSQTHPEIYFMDELRDIDNYGNKLDNSIVFEYSAYLRTLEIAVDTHNKKISRPATIFRALDKYLSVKSPWENKKLKRSPKEETHTAHRKPFPKENEQKMFDLLKPESILKVLNKAEVQVLFHILKYTGQRQKDCANLSWNEVNLDRKRLYITQAKTGKQVTIPIADELYEMLLKAQGWKQDGNEYVLPKTAKRYARKAKDGTDTGVDLINKQLLGVIESAGLEPSISIPGRKKKLTIYGVHSFRHGFASHCAETGVPRAVCSSILGADADIIDNYYVHIGEEAQLKAIEGLSACSSKSNKERLNEAIDYIKGLKNRSLELEKVYELLTE